MASYTQANRPLEVITPLGKDILLITGFRGEEGISRLFHFKIDMVADVKKDIAFEQVLGQKISVRLDSANKPRYFSGICTSFSQGEADTDFCAYKMEMAPAFWLWTKVAQSRIFQQQSVPDILKVVLKGLDPNVAYQLSGTYQPRNYCVQYRETDFDFACRLMEEEGIFYFFTHTADGHKMVVADSAASHPELPLGSKVAFEKRVQEKWADDRILTWQKHQELLTGQFTLWDHCFEMPGKNLLANASISATAQLGKVKHQLTAGKAASREVYDYPGDYAHRFDGVNSGGGDQAAEIQKIFTDNARTVGIRQQQEAVQGVVIHGISSCRNLVSGHKFTLQKHVHAEGDYLVTELSHEVKTAIDYRAGRGVDMQYSNTFTAIPLAVPFRPQRETPIPYVQGTQTATVVGPAGKEIYTDKYGRVKVQFNWDRVGKKDASSSCWVRVGQAWAGKRWGASFWPRVGQEVIVAFLEGNPDWPIIVGSVYNAEQMPPYLGDGLDPKHPKHNELSGIKSNTTPGGQGFNEWRFDDTKGKEQIFVHAQRNMDTTVLNDALLRVFGNNHVIVGVENKSGDHYELIYQDAHLNVKRDQIEKIERDMQLLVARNVDIAIGNNKTEAISNDSALTIQGNHTEAVGKDQALTVSGNLMESVGKAYSLTVSGDRNESVQGTQSLSVSGNQYEKIGQNHAMEASTAIYFKAGTNMVLEAGTQLTLKVGGNCVVIDSSGVSIIGSLVKINSGGSAGSGSAPSPTSPTAPASPANAKQAAPTAPTLADDSKSGAKSAPG